MFGGGGMQSEHMCAIWNCMDWVAFVLVELNGPQFFFFFFFFFFLRFCFII